MTIIRTMCTSCGPVEFEVGSVTVRMCEDDDFTAYTFCCPRCRKADARAAPRPLVEKLVSSGVRLVLWRLPAELREPHSRAPMTSDDLVEFQRVLAEDDWFEQLSAQQGG